MNLNLPDNALKFHTTPAEMEDGALIAKMYASSVNRMPFFGRSPYALSGLGIQVCDQNTVGGQWACVQSNEQEMAAAACAKWGYPDDCAVANMAPPSNVPAPTGTYLPPSQATQLFGQAPATAPPSAPSAPGNYSPRVVFKTSRGGTSVYPGDTWTISITGAQPNSAVSVKGTHPDGGTATQAFGNTDANGNWSLSGTFTADMVGSWSEIWTAGNANAGSFAFSVLPTPATKVPAPPPANPPTGPGPGVSNSQQTSSPFSNQTILLVAAGLGAFLLLGGKQ